MAFQDQKLGFMLVCYSFLCVYMDVYHYHNVIMRAAGYRVRKEQRFFMQEMRTGNQPGRIAHWC